MSHTFSVHKSATALKVGLTTVAASLLASAFVPAIFVSNRVMPNREMAVEQSVTQLADSSFTIPQMEEQAPNPAIVLATALTGAVAIGTALSLTKGSQGSNKSGSLLTSQGSTGVSLNQPSRKLQQKLLTLLHNDSQAANRLLAQAQRKYPHKSPNWYAEKVIYDLQRDLH
jgi:hypothetical protein